MINIISWCIFGLIAGALARFLVPGRDVMGCLATMVLGIIGSVVGGFIGSMLFGGGPGGEFQPAGFMLSVIGAIIALVVYRKMSGPR